MEYKSEGIQLLKPVCWCSPASCPINLSSGNRGDRVVWQLQSRQGL